jgi:hypothetical protein
MSVGSGCCSSACFSPHQHVGPQSVINAAHALAPYTTLHRALTRLNLELRDLKAVPGMQEWMHALMTVAQNKVGHKVHLTPAVQASGLHGRLSTGYFTQQRHPETFHNQGSGVQRKQLPLLGMTGLRLRTHTYQDWWILAAGTAAAARAQQQVINGRLG